MKDPSYHSNTSITPVFAASSKKKKKKKVGFTIPVLAFLIVERIQKKEGGPGGQSQHQGCCH